MPINLGTSAIDDVRIGTTQADKVMLGANLAWQAFTPPDVGDPFLDGFFTAMMDPTGSIIAADDSQTPVKYALVMSDKSLETTLAYKEDATADSYHSDWDGLGNTASQVADAKTYAAAEYCDGLTVPSDGGSKYYLPSRAELLAAYWAFKPITDNNYLTDYAGADFPFSPVVQGVNPYSDPTTSKFTTGIPAQTSLADFQSGGAQALADGYNWTSTEATNTYGWILYTSGSKAGRQSYNSKTYAYTVRPFRRLEL